MPQTRHPVISYTLAVVSVAVAIGLRMLLDSLIGASFPFATVFLAILVTAWVGGMRPALVALVLGGVASAYFLLSPKYSFALPANEQIGLILYFFVGAAIAVLGGAMHAARLEAQQREEDAVRAKQDLQQEFDRRESVQQELRASQASLEQESERLRVTLSSIGDAVIATDASGLVTFLNGVAESLTGWTTEQAHGRSLAEVFRIINEETRAQVENPVDKVLVEGRIVGLANHTLLIARDGTERPIDDSAAPIRDASGDLVGVVLVFRDITQRKKADQLRSQLAAIVDSSDDAIIGKSFDGRVTSWNRGAERLYGYTAEEIVGKPFDVLIPSDMASELPEVLEKIRRGAETDHYETVRLTKTGRRIPVSAQISAVRNERGEVIGASVIAREITSRLAAERRRNARLAVTQSLAHAASAEEALPQILQALCENLQWNTGNYWQVDEQSVRIGCRFTHNCSELDVGEFEELTRRLKLRLGEGLTGRVWQSGKPCWIPDVTRDDNFPRATAAQKVGLRAAFAFPIHVGEHVLGVVEFFSSEIRSPDADLLEMVATLGSQLGHFLERQQAEQALRRSERELSDFFENATTGLHWVGPDGIILRVNQAELDMLGYAREEYVGRHIADFHADRAVIDDILTRLAAGEKLRECPARLVCKDGSLKDVLIDSSVMWEDGKFVHTRCFTRDVTQQKRVQDNLRQSEERLQFLADASAALASLVDYHSTLQKVARQAVPRFADWCAIDMLDQQGRLERVAVAHVDPDKVTLAHELQRRFPPDPQSQTGVWAILRSGTEELMPEITDDLIERSVPDPELRRILAELGLRSYMGVPLVVRGKTMGVITFIAAESGRRYSTDDLQVARDLADRAAIAIDNSQLYAELREAARKKDEFLATLAHELRNPLAPLRNGLEIMQLIPDDAEATAEARSIMERQLDQMVRLVDDLLDISRITRGKLELRKAQVELATVIRTAVETSRPLIEAAQHQFTLSLPPERIVLDADTTRLAQVFSNLLNNAAKYTPPGGKIDLEAELQGDYAVVRVRDTGVGISREMLPKVFDMFTQVDRSLARAQGGLGIGLTLVQRLVDMHGGSVEVRSNGEGQGSEFTVRLSVLAPVAPQAAPAESPAAGLTPARRRILVVDDNRDSAVTLGMMLKLMGNEIRMAGDGLEAVQAASEFRPDLVLLDIGLPKLSGYDAARRIRQEPWGQEIVLVALTGWGQEEDRRRSKEAGFNHHFVKPIDIVDLKRVLLDGER